MDKVQADHGTNKIIGEKSLEAMPDCIKILEDRITEGNTEIIIGMKITAEKEVGVGLGKDNFQGIIIIIIMILEGMIGA